MGSVGKHFLDEVIYVGWNPRFLLIQVLVICFCGYSCKAQPSAFKVFVSV